MLPHGRLADDMNSIEKKDNIGEARIVKYNHIGKDYIENESIVQEYIVEKCILKEDNFYYQREIRLLFLNY
jgi:hypothetical protein